MNLSTMSRTVQLFARLLDTRSATEPFVPVRGEKPLLPLRPAEQPLPRCTPEEEGLSSRQLRRFLEELRAPDLFMHSVMVLRHGRVVCEAAYGAQSLLAPK